MSTPTTTTQTPQTPAPAPAASPREAPGAPAKAAKAAKAARHVAWADFTASMATMPLQDARKLKPQDIIMHMGPVMDEAQFEAYRKARQAQGANVTVLKK
jgi:hypothetical protein